MINNGVPVSFAVLIWTPISSEKSPTQTEISLDNEDDYFSKDEDVLTAWLTDLRFEEYFNPFLAAGYGMPTISRSERDS